MHHTSIGDVCCSERLKSEILWESLALLTTSPSDRSTLDIILGDLPQQVTDEGRFFFGLEKLADGILAVWGSVVAVHVFKKRPHSLAILRRFLKVNFWCLAVDLFAAVAFLGADIGVASVLRSLVFLLPCYFKVSKTVRGVYGTNL
jgi:hypothetical protein